VSYSSPETLLGEEVSSTKWNLSQIGGHPDTSVDLPERIYDRDDYVPHILFTYCSEDIHTKITLWYYSKES
jgi:hypothetical protein